MPRSVTEHISLSSKKRRSSKIFIARTGIHDIPIFSAPENRKHKGMGKNDKMRFFMFLSVPFI
jgi:hypothetical protein